MPQNNEPVRAKILRSSASRGTHIRAVHTALVTLLEVLNPEPSERRVRIRDNLRALERAYPALRLSHADVAQLVEEMDDEPIEDVP